MQESDPTREGDVIPIVEETAEIGIRTRTTGRTRVSTHTETVTEDVEAEIETHGVEVERVPVGRDLEPGATVPGPREEGAVTIIPVLEEVLVVEKRLRLVEEIHIRRTTTTEAVNVPVTLRRQVADVEHIDAAADPSNHQTREDPANGL